VHALILLVLLQARGGPIPVALRWGPVLEASETRAGGSELRVGAAVGVSVGPSAALKPELEALIMFPRIETGPGFRLVRGGARTSLLWGLGIEQSGVGIELSLGPTLYTEWTRWTSPTDVSGAWVAGGGRARLSMGPASERWSMGAGWSVSPGGTGMDLQLELYR
jgi:hypothetical protein